MQWMTSFKVGPTPQTLVVVNSLDKQHPLAQKLLARHQNQQNKEK